MTTPVAILRFPTVTARTGTPRSTILLRIKQGLWVRPVRTGPRSIGFPDYEVEELNKARIRGLSDDEIRKLVAKLERRRASIEGEGGEADGKSPQATAPAAVASLREPRTKQKAPVKPKVKSAGRVAPKKTRSPQAGA